MIAEIFSVGTEILLGEILNTNSKYLSSELAFMGIEVYNHTSVGDNETRLLNAIKSSYEKCDLIISTGGLGPTDDDLTKEVFSKYFGKNLIENKEALENLNLYFKNSNAEMPKSNLKQALIPEGATVLKNANGTAAGCMIEKNGKIAILLPGPPNEVVPMFEKEVKPILAKLSSKVFYSKSLNLCGIGESKASEMIRELMQTSKNPTIAPYAGNNEVRFRVTASASNIEEAKSLSKPVIKELYKTFENYIYGEDNETLEEVIIKKLKEKNLTISSAESCTGGMLSSTLVNVSGVSSVFLNGVVAYSNESKINMLKVNENSLKTNGAVSKEIALEMAKNIKNISGSKIGISTTGISGPTSDNTNKPMGLIYIGISTDEFNICKEYNLKGNRQKIREKTVNLCLYNLLKILT